MEELCCAELLHRDPKFLGKSLVGGGWARPVVEKKNIKKKIRE